MPCSPHSDRGSALRAGAVLLLGAACGGNPAPEGAARHLVLISLDTVRADRLGCYGHAHARTEAIDALASDGVLFADATAAAPTTLASHAAMLTGTPPHTHGVPRNGYVLASGNVTLAEVLRANGFRTLAAVGAFPLAAAFGLDQGFDAYDDTVGSAEGDADYAERDAAAVTDAALALVDERLGEPDRQRGFLFVHYFDAHAPHVPPPPFDTAFPREHASAPTTLEDGVVRAADDQYELLLGRRPGRSVVVQGLPAAVVDAADGRPRGLDASLDALYLGELAYLDRELGRLLDGLEARGVLEDAVVVLTADHGETMWDHADFWNHGLALFQTTLHVPLLVRGPAGVVPSGLVVDTPVSGIDVAPTALALLGVDVPSSMEGVDLSASFGTTPFERGPVFAEATMPFGVERPQERWPNADKPHAVRDGRWKYVRWGYNGHEQLFDLAADPGERRNLLGGVPAEGAREQATALGRLLDAWRAGARPFASEYRAGRDAGALRTLDALGYGGGR